MSRNGSWRICEEVSVSIVSRHPGDRDRHDLLGRRAPCADVTVDDTQPNATFDAGADAWPDPAIFSFDGYAWNGAAAGSADAGTAARFAADAAIAESEQHEQSEQHTGHKHSAIGDARIQQPGHYSEFWNDAWRSRSRCRCGYGRWRDGWSRRGDQQRLSDLHRHDREAGQQVRAAGRVGEEL